MTRITKIQKDTLDQNLMNFILPWRIYLEEYQIFIKHSATRLFLLWRFCQSTRLRSANGKEQT